jgi:cytochrome c
MKKVLLLMVAALMINGAASAQDVANGEKVFRKCKTCHDVGEKAKNKIGPVLNGLEGRKSGTIEGYRYTDANKNSGIVWNEAEFIDYIKNPRAKIPGTKMTFIGIKKEDDAKDLWAYLTQFGPDGKKK